MTRAQKEVLLAAAERRLRDLDGNAQRSERCGELRSAATTRRDFMNPLQSAINALEREMTDD